MIDPQQDSAGCFVSQTGKSSWLQTGSGGRVSVTRPLVKEINIHDIGVALAKQTRFNGHCSHFYSVAQHCVLGGMFVDKLGLSEAFAKRLKFEFLLHDATEAYVGDLIKPVKIMIPQFAEIERGFEKTIQKAFGLDPSNKITIKWLDNAMCAWEKRDLLPNSEPWPNMIDIEEFNMPPIVPWTWKEAEIKFYDAFAEYTS